MHKLLFQELPMVKLPRVIFLIKKILFQESLGYFINIPIYLFHSYIIIRFIKFIYLMIYLKCFEEQINVL